MRDLLFITLQYLLPHHAISRLVGWFAATEIRWIKRLLINKFAATYDVNMAEAQEPDLDTYSSFNAFFCRALKPDARSLTPNPDALLCPADGAISQLGKIDKQTIFQAKGKSFKLSALLGGDETLATHFENGSFCTIYLSPKDYHRVHMPAAGKLLKMTHVPGALFSVNPTTVNNVDNLFARNERVVCIFETRLGPLAVILVGAMIVASIETVWAGQIAPIGRAPSHFYYGQSELIELGQGEEMGRFKLGSTVVMLTPPGAAQWANLKEGDAVTLGQTLTTTVNPQVTD